MAIQFTHEAVVAAVREAHKHCLRVCEPGPGSVLIAEMTMDQILRAAWTEQEKGDFNVTDMRTTVANLKSELLDLSRKKTEAEEKYGESYDRFRNAVDAIRELEALTHNIKQLLKATKKIKDRQEQFVDAWNSLNEWHTIADVCLDD